MHPRSVPVSALLLNQIFLLLCFILFSNCCCFNRLRNLHIGDLFVVLKYCCWLFPFWSDWNYLWDRCPCTENRLIQQYSMSSNYSSSLFTWVPISGDSSINLTCDWSGMDLIVGATNPAVESLWIWLEIDQKSVFDSGDSITIPSICASLSWLITTVELADLFMCDRSWFHVFIAIIISSRF